MKKNGAKETRHLVAMAKPEFTACGRPVGKVLLWAKKAAPAHDDKTVCGRCKVLSYGLPATKKTSGPHGPKKTTIDIPVEARKAKPGKRLPALQVLGDRMPGEMWVTFKRKEYLAVVKKDGTILVEGHEQIFNSPSRAGKAIAGREVDGWTFWSYMKADGSLEKLDALRKAVA